MKIPKPSWRGARRVTDTNLRQMQVTRHNSIHTIPNPNPDPTISSRSRQQLWKLQHLRDDRIAHRIAHHTQAVLFVLSLGNKSLREEYRPTSNTAAHQVVAFVCIRTTIAFPVTSGMSLFPFTPPLLYDLVWYHLVRVTLNEYISLNEGPILLD